MKPTRIAEVIQILEQIAPPSYQESYDNAGLQTGHPNQEITGIIITLDCTEAVLDEAIHHNCNLIIAHHPVIFRPIKKLTGSNSVEKIIIKAIRHNLAIYVSHTNLDNVTGGVNSKICEKLGLLRTRVLAPKTGILQKLVTFVPVPDSEKVLQALYQAGAGSIGDYQNCSFQVAGTGSFMPLAGAEPAIGQINKQEFVAENRIEVIFPAFRQSQIIFSLFQAHPYEEVAYDIIPLVNAHQRVGAGMIGELPEPMPEDIFIKHLKQCMQVPLVKHTAFLNKNIKRVAVCGGSGSFLTKEAIKNKADIYITGDIKYHEFFDAEEKLIIADIGHYESEVFTKEIFYDIIIKSFRNFAVLLSKVNTNPVRFS